MKKSFGALTLVYPTPVWVIGTYDKEEKPNAATVAWGGVCSSQPPAVAISLQKSRYTYDNIIYVPEKRDDHGVGKYLGNAFKIGKKMK